MEQDPDRDRIAADEQRIGALLRAVEAPAPAALHSQIAARNAEVVQRPPRQWRMPAFALGLAGAAAAAVVALVLALSATTTPPTVLRVAKVALTSPAGSAPHGLVAKGTSL